jgi:hypothetical protein
MMTTPTTETSLSRGDRAAMYATILLALAGFVATAWIVVTRLVEVLPGRDVPVLVPFVGETAPLPIGPDGASVEVAVESATVIVPQPAAATQFALVAEPLVIGVAIAGGILLLALFCWNVARGAAFSRRNVRLVQLGAVVLVIGWFVGSLLTTMTVNGALSAVSEYTYEGITFAANWTAPFGLLALGAVGAAFQIGQRLQRETEGLV